MAQVAALHRMTTRRFERQPERLETALATGTALGQGCGHGSEDGEAARTVPTWGGMQMMDDGERGSHENAHEICLIGSLMFTGAMSYRAGSNPYSGPGGAMLASLGAVSALYHLDKMLEWRRWEEERVQEAERMLREHYEHAGALEGAQAAGAQVADVGRQVATAPPPPGAQAR